MKEKFLYSIAVFIFSAISIAYAQKSDDEAWLKKLDNEVPALIKEGNIPGVSIAIVKNGRSFIRTYGYADLARKNPVKENTLFELGSCSKAFTALAVIKLVRETKLNLDTPVSHYLPWFRVYYNGAVTQITPRQLLHHTSGIPWNTISKIKQSDNKNALEQNVRLLIGQELNNLPGHKFEYATINYDVLALLIEKISGQSFESYLQHAIIDPIGLRSTSIGKSTDSKMAGGYKIGFFEPWYYDAPVFKGNNAAGYVVSNGTDVDKWLRFQLGLDGNPLYSLASVTHARDETVPPHDLAFYAMGWEVSISGNGELYHAGANPNFTSYVALRPVAQTGVAVLANSNSPSTTALGKYIMGIVAGEDVKMENAAGDEMDKLFSLASFILAGYGFAVITLLIITCVNIASGRRRYSAMTLSKFRKALVLLLVLLPFCYGVYLIPTAIADFTWDAMIVWTPQSFPVFVAVAIAAVAISYMAYLISLLFPETNKFKGAVPRMTLVSIISGLANMGLIVLITSSIGSPIPMKYLVFYYALTLCAYLIGRRYVQVSLIRFSRELTFDLRVKLIGKILSTSYQRFEKIDQGRVYSALNDDVNTIGESSNLFVMLITSIFTIIGAFFFLASIAFWATVLTILLIIALSTLYFFVGKSNNKYFEQARDVVNNYIRLMSGMIDGFKEISLNRNKKIAYRKDITESANQFKEKIATANVRFANAFMVGESLLVILLGVVAFAMPAWFPNVQLHTIMSFVIVLLYLIGPINSVLNAVPSVMNFKVAWKRIQEFTAEIPANLNLEEKAEPVASSVESMKVRGLQFQYKNKSDHHFEIGPIDLEIHKGEILFIIGGNGSGKTTLAKLLTGLYEPDEGVLMINDKAVSSAYLSEHFSAVFSPPHLFHKLYTIDSEKRAADIEQYLKLLDLEKKVSVIDNNYSTLDLSGGQRKRLALLQCYLEDSPIYLFDEWAADQDPGYRKFFYRTLLPEMKKAGKIIIAITHDDHYFDVADKVFKMNNGVMEPYIQEQVYQKLTADVV